MRKIIPLLSLFFPFTISLQVYAQDPCATAIKLTNVINYCSDPKQYTNVGVTPSTFPTASCWTNTNAKQDIWFKFTAVGADVNVTVKTNGLNGTIKSPNISFIEQCTPTTINTTACTNGSNANNTLLYKGGLNIGQDYYIRISSTAANAGNFTLCIDNNTPPLNPQADCDKAVKLCDKTPIHLDGLSGEGTKKNESEFDNSCFEAGGENNNCWYYWVCGTSGTLTFDLIPNDGVSDIDFILYSINNGSDVCSGRTVQRCSATNCLNPGGGTGLNETDTETSETLDCTLSPNGTIPANQNGYVRFLNMVAGRTYALLIDNANAKTGFSLSFGGTGTFQGPSAKIVADKVSICAGESIKYTSNSNAGSTLEWNFASGNGTPAGGNGPGPYTVQYDTPGNYAAILKAKIGECVSTDYVNITVNEAPTVTVDSKEICEGEEATLTATPSVSGGTYSWNPNPSSSNDSTMKDSPVTDQTYTVTYKLAGCESTGMGTINVNKKPEVTVNSVDVCAGTAATLTATLKETTGIYQYVWSPGGATTKSITVNPTVSTVYTVTVTSAFGCVGTGSGTVNITSKLSVEAGNDTLICEGATIQLVAKPYVPGYTYKWTASTGSVSNASIYNPTATPAETTTYTVDVTTDNGCMGSDMVVVSIDPLMTPTVTPTNITCNGVCDGKTDVNVIGGAAPYTYSWNGGCDKASCTSLCAGSYTVTVKDKIGCIAKADATITEPTAIALQTSSLPGLCGQPTGSATVVASGGTAGYTYEWDDPAKQKTATATGLISKKYCVTVSDGNGCKKTACVDVLDQPGFNASLIAVTPVSCNGLCDGTAEVTATGGTPPFSYSWNTTPGAQTNAKATGLCAGNYIATIKDATGCTDTIHVKIVQPQPVTLEPVGLVTICIGSSATLNAVGHGGDGNYTYSWLPESPLTTSSISVSPIVNTDYHVVIRDGKGCSSAPLVIKVNVNPPLKITASADVNLCLHDSAKISAVGSGGSGGPYTYTWTPGMQTGSSLIVKPTISTTYTVTIKDNCGTPTGKDSVKVTVNALPAIKLSADTLQGCSPLTVNFTDGTQVAGGVITNWKWDFGDKSGSDSKDPTHVFTAIGTSINVYSITLTVKSSNGCSATITKKDWVRVFPIPIADFEAPVSNSILNPTVHFTNTSIGAISWIWDFDDALSSPDNNTSTLYSPNHTYSDIGQYCVKLAVKNAGGCLAETFHCINIDPQFVLYIPNAFTPNDDGDNDSFYAKGEYINEFEMRIFDRWGNMVYYADAMNKPWNGKKNNLGEVLLQDLYVYQINIRDNKSKKHKYVGTVMLIRGG